MNLWPFRNSPDSKSVKLDWSALNTWFSELSKFTCFSRTSILSWSLLLFVAMFVFISRISNPRLWTFLSSANLIKLSWFSNSLKRLDLMSTEEFKLIISLVSVFWFLTSVKFDKQFACAITRNPSTTEDHMLIWEELWNLYAFILLVSHIISFSRGCIVRSKLSTVLESLCY